MREMRISKQSLLSCDEALSREDERSLRNLFATEKSVRKGFAKLFQSTSSTARLDAFSLQPFSSLERFPAVPSRRYHRAFKRKLFTVPRMPTSLCAMAVTRRL
jgi:hypothetical protein